MLKHRAKDSKLTANFPERIRPEAGKALSLKGEEYDDDDDVASQNHFTNRAITVLMS